MERQSDLTLGSLFDGSAGFPLGGLISGITPVWASEVEPFPIRVTTKRIPNMQHLGDVSALNGAELSPVDIITFGSPCQDMSMAGKRTGLHGSRSCLFYEAVRIVKEMRYKTNGRYPRFVVWENVPGAFSSNKGEDFRAVLEALCDIKNEAVIVPKPSGKWENAGCIMGEDFSIAWRLLDAQYWGVPQRRKRIYLVADFAGRCAGKVLFESEGVSRYSPQGFKSWEGTARSSEESSGTPDKPPLVFENHSRDARYKGPLDAAPTVLSTYGTGGNNQPFVAQPIYCTSKNSYHTDAMKNLANTLVATDYKDPPVISGSPPEYIVRRLTPVECARLQGFPDWWCADLGTEDPSDEEISWWSEVFSTHARVLGKKAKTKPRNQIIKWLKEPYSDAAAYKMWGNGVALPNVCFVLAGIVYYAQKTTE